MAMGDNLACIGQLLRVPGSLREDPPPRSPAQCSAWLWKLQSLKAIQALNKLFSAPSLQDAAAAFCAKNGLASAIVGPLTRHIEDNLLKAQQEAAAEVSMRSLAESAAGGCCTAKPALQLQRAQQEDAER